MSRAVAALLVASVALSLPLAAGASPHAKAKGRAAGGTIALRARINRGQWQRSLHLKLVKLQLKDFSMCAIWNNPKGSAFDCRAAARRALPAGTIMRLEQRPRVKAPPSEGSPGWGIVGASTGSALGAVISNLVTGNKRGTFKYRVTLRDRANHILAQSNTFTLVWE
jgi:hypothetical protein